MKIIQTHDIPIDQRDPCLALYFIGYLLDWEGPIRMWNNYKNNVNFLMANQNIQQEQFKEIFKLNNLTRVESTRNRRILKQLDVKLVRLNHSVYS